MSSTWTRLDDTDPKIVYEGNWRTGGIPHEYNTTTHGAVNASGCSALLTFTGTQIKIGATLDTKNPEDLSPIFNLYLDGKLVLRYEPNLTFSGVQIVENQQLMPIFSSPILDNATHTLLISNQVKTANTIWLDYFDLLSLDPTTSSQPLPNLSTHSPSNTQLGGGSNTPSPSVSANTEKSLTLSAGGIVGITLGAIGLILMFTLAFLLWKQEKKQTRLSNYPSKHFYDVITQAELITLTGILQPFTIYPRQLTTLPETHDHDHPPPKRSNTKKLSKHTNLQQPPMYREAP
ncbi:hypothetical protein K435DRAFT_878390 [Dendrothele bispora CBS 962.96]|uniref:Uncharacterized protein n=1 Tax=Dendrothele bispora (strain CBS 962.96) TaxID=1314807 RepID=A0A4V4HAV6_DENBC|nr:hypothetical protein K435DRAFT_878390 [Dendrothele bispora CBS 962.96]